MARCSSVSMSSEMQSSKYELEIFDCPKVFKLRTVESFQLKENTARYDRHFSKNFCLCAHCRTRQKPFARKK